MSGLARKSLLVFIAAIPLDALSFTAGTSVGFVVGMFAAAVGAIALLERQTLRRSAGIHRWLVAFVIWSAASTFWSLDPDASLRQAVTLSQLLVFAWLYWQLMNEDESVPDTMAAYVVGALAAAARTVVNYASGQALVADQARYAALGSDPNDLGVTLAIALPMAWHLLQSAKGWRRVVGLVYPVLGLAAIALTASRGAALATVAALTIIPLTLGSKTWLMRFATGGVVAAAVCGLIAVVPGTSWDRIMSTRVEVEGGNLSDRTVLWQAGLEVLPDHFFVGVGSGAYGEAISRSVHTRNVAHNTVLSVVTELGIVGLALFLGAAVSALRLVRQSERQLRIVGWIVFLTWAVGASSLTWEFRKPTWFVLTLLAGFAMAKREPRNNFSSEPREPI